jgi:FkbM family methyltransferase
MKLGRPMKYAIQAVLNRFGWEVRRHELAQAEKLKRFLDQHHIQCVLDVGANIGQFASELRTSGFSGTIISFEPQLDAYNRLIKAAASDPNWILAPRGAVGDVTGEIDINTSMNSVSSSILPMLERHSQSAPSSRYIGVEKVPVFCLDNCDLIDCSRPTFLKIDTQGFEQRVLDGARDLLPDITGLQLELSLAGLYDGQADFVSLLDQLLSQGFEIWSLDPGFADRATGRQLQADAIFFKPTK